MPRAGPKRVQRYSLDFKLNAVRLSEEEGVEVQAVAGALDIHPFMLSRWRKQVRDGVLGVPHGRDGQPKSPAARDDSLLREIKRLQQLEKEHKLLLEEHDLLKKAIRFWSELERKRSASSSGNATRRR